MTGNTVVETPALAYPIGSIIHVYKDDGKWDNYPAWFLRSNQDLRNLFVCSYDLPTDEDGDVDYSLRQWEKVSQQLVNDHPDCLFIYT